MDNTALALPAVRPLPPNPSSNLQSSSSSRAADAFVEGMRADEERRAREKLLKEISNKDGKDHYGYPGGEPGSGEPKDPDIKAKRDKVRDVSLETKMNGVGDAGGYTIMKGNRPTPF